MWQRGGLWLFYTVNLVYSESGNTFSPEKEENIFTLYNNDIHKIHCYVKKLIFHSHKKLRSHRPPCSAVLRSKGVHVFPWCKGYVTKRF